MSYSAFLVILENRLNPLVGLDLPPHRPEEETMKQSLINSVALLALLMALTFSISAQVPVEVPERSPAEVPVIETLKQTAQRLHDKPGQLNAFFRSAYLQLNEIEQKNFVIELQYALLQKANKLLNQSLDDIKIAEHNGRIRGMVEFAWADPTDASIERLLQQVYLSLPENDQQVLSDELLKFVDEAEAEILRSKKRAPIVPNEIVNVTDPIETPSRPAPRCERIAAGDEPIAGVTIPPATKVEGTWTGSFTTGIYSQYWAPSAGFPIHNKPVIQSEFDAVYTKGSQETGFLLWHSQGVHDCAWCSGGEEIDFGFFHAWNLSHNRRIELRDWHFFLGSGVGSDINNPSIKFSRVHGLSDTFKATVFGKADAYIRTNRKGPKPGAIFAGGVLVEKELRGGWSASINTQIGIDPFGAFGFPKNSIIYRQDYAMKYGRGSWSISPAVTFGGGNDAARPGKVTFGLTFAKSFPIGRQ